LKAIWQYFTELSILSSFDPGIRLFDISPNEGQNYVHMQLVYRRVEQDGAEEDPPVAISL
jgi:hypothetical protein